MWKSFLVIFLAVQLNLGENSDQTQSNLTDCYETNDNKYVYFSTKTPYRLIRRNNDGDLLMNKDCSPKQFWLLSRHGTRLPGTKEMEKMKSELPKIRDNILSNHRNGKKGSLCQDDLKNLEEWEFSANVDDSKYLVREGYKEMFSLAQRYSSMFPSLLERPFKNESYKLQYTSEERTNASAVAFAKGLFGKKDYLNVFYHKPPEKDLLLRFYKSCKKWKKEVDDNATATIELTMFQESAEFKAMIEAVTKRLGFTDPLKLDQIDRMYSICSYEKAWQPRNLSSWCAVFSQNDLEILEYREDLEYYYEDGYGYPINYEQACVTVKDAYDNFRNIVTQATSQNQRGIFYFTHSGTLLKVLARFGLFQDVERPTHSNRNCMRDRKWRTSFIDAFGSNLALVLSECQNKAFYVTAYSQEQPVLLPGCGSEFCRFEDFTQQFGSMTEQCNLDEICRI